MTETVRINATLNKELLEKVDFYAERNYENRSTAIRQLVAAGLKQKLQDHVVDKIRNHKLTIREGAELLGIDYWELQELLEARNVTVLDLTEAELREQPHNEF